MRITVVFLLAWWLSGSIANAQDTGETPERDTTWTNAYQFGFNFNQAAFSDNWTGGGINSIALTGLFNYLWSYQKRDWRWDNEIDLRYGLVKNEGENFSRKTQDIITFDSKLGQKISPEWSAFLSINFLTQFAPGYRFLDDDPDSTRVRISDFMAPGFLTAALGFEYRPNERFWLRLSPFSPRLTFVTAETVSQNLALFGDENDIPPNYGVPEGETVREEWLAAQIIAQYIRSFSNDINLKVRHMLFANYEELAFTTIDHRFELTFTAKLTQYITFNFGTVAIYDVDQNPQVQLSQLMGIGFLLQHTDPSREE